MKSLLLVSGATARIYMSAAASSGTKSPEDSMLDLVMLTLGICFFAVSIAYAFACNRL
jgi:hypothetical protein